MSSRGQWQARDIAQSGSENRAAATSIEASRASVNRRAFLQRAVLGAGAVAAGGAAFGAWSRTANASSRSAMAHAATMSGMDMSATDMSAKHTHGANLRDANTMDVDQVQEGRRPPVSSTGVIEMEGTEFYKPVRLPPKPGAKPLLTKHESDDLERRLSCPCPCNLDVFTCRTTDFSCGNSPAVHRDVQALVAGGYSADEIMNAMIGAYGNNILMAPPKKGVNLIAWFGPFVALAAGLVGVNALLRSWRRNAAEASATAGAVSPVHVNEYGATNEEMERLRAALRDDK